MRPVDLQGMVTRTQDIERLQRIQQQHPTLAQEQFSERLRREAEENEKRVRSAEESMPTRIRDEQRERSGGRNSHSGNAGEEGQRNSEKDELDAGESGSVKGRIIDVKA